ncbi:hypothetical protein [Yersinia rohdei]|uniref:hypothetical protein n=1 Tax=Yersinia rohdei TaxID=29485 RepID=UPI0011A9BF0D|nr:hypothetical protein [Yersinia rohdei]
MSSSITVVCCECENHYWDEEVSDEIAESYEDEVEFIYDAEDGEKYPDPGSFSQWALNNRFPRESCSGCGSDGAFSGWTDND